MDGSQYRGLVESVCAMSKLENLSLGLGDSVGPLDDTDQPIGAPALLPLLSKLTFDGFSGHFDLLASRVNAPQLVHLNIFFVDSSVVTVPSLSRFVGTSTKASQSIAAQLEIADEECYFKTFTPSQEAEGPLISLRVTPQNGGHGMFMTSTAIILRSLSSALASVDVLVIKRHRSGFRDESRPIWEGHGADWHSVPMTFGGVTSLYVENFLTLAIAQTLGQPQTDLLPNLRRLRLLFYSFDGHDQSNILSKLDLLLVVRSASGRFIDLCCQTISFHRQHSALIESALRGV
ncbi:hypothetical protein BC834DRAFT_908715 [Gloeopeniophorella convolvens]|nr:hypothetical protein BC834DRAFT_908715 [Gloeopeniophorella convolvens]